MASRPNPRPTGQNRRRPGPYLPGSLILMLIAVALAVAFAFGNPLGSAQTIRYSDLLKLSEQHNIKELTFVGKDRATGEVKDPKTELAESLKLPADGKFSVALPPA